MFNICGQKISQFLNLPLKQNVNLLRSVGQHQRQFVKNVSTKRRPKIPNSEHLYPGQKPEHKVTAFGWALLAIPVATFGLGCWQVQRKSWKENLIRQLEETTKAPPIDLPDNLEDLKDMEYRPVKVRGHFLHDREMLMGPRAMLNKGESMTTGGLISKQETSIGFLVITPFQLEGREYVWTFIHIVKLA
jgi:surfeit locus 1 family protein